MIVWQKSMDLCTIVYKITATFPKYELFGLTSQIRRCAVAIPSNIAEGQIRGHMQEYIQFLRISMASGAELETQLLVALNIEYIEKKAYDEVFDLLQEVMKMLSSLINKLHFKSTL
ncbi:MAG: S23 ribosomal protein [Candidatus Amesbacteria bacterium GW2011_GWB1_47_19]|nr:MAG: S23 ribosomal protein [Candidatus Amesbacteria bacterium GW2011_GWA1_44_24]KKU31212.1 MAG: S23 ribosomal protein [Candidatus Amesbacteria bacterium GW2011_GWC1_46_24]KKU67134.1 MAG: S23 ribosomal protein [Candidatus Amesbacteria bacterium GW2011_GWB1_47_19]